MIRKGFVSNSSSSSFILAVRRYHKVQSIDGGVFVHLANELTNFLQGCRLTSYEQIVHDKLIDEYGNDYASVTDEWYAQDIEDTRVHMEAKVRAMLGPDEDFDDWCFHLGEASNQDGEIVNQMLYEERVEIRTENVRLG
jgi:hypothetical protein